MANRERPSGSGEEFKGLKKDPRFTEGKKLMENRAIRFLSNSAFKAIYFGLVLAKGSPRHHLPRETRTGMLEDSIFQQKLWSPNQDETELNYREASAGQWVGYDFHRPEEFGKRVKKRETQNSKGKLFVLDLDELSDHTPDEYTPTWSIDVLRMEQALQIDSQTPQEMTEKGYIGETTLGEAYDRVKLADKYAKALNEIGETPVYQITPKGNGLVFLLNIGGEASPKTSSPKSKQPKLFPIPLLQPRPALG